MSALQMMALGRRLSNLYTSLCAPICRKYGINQTCLDILLFCANHPECNTARDIGAVRGIKSGIASVAIEALIENGLIRREDDAHDRRIRRLTPTGKAAAIIEEGQALQRYFTAALRQNVTEEELSSLQGLIDKIETNIPLLGKKEALSC